MLFQCTRSQFISWLTRNGYETRSVRVFVLPVITPRPDQSPTVMFDQPGDFADFHIQYYLHQSTRPLIFCNSLLKAALQAP
jgi:hypothetical protein